MLKTKLPLLSEADPSAAAVSTQSGLQTLSDAVRGNPSRGPLHIVVQLDMRTVVGNPSLMA